MKQIEIPQNSQRFGDENQAFDEAYHSVPYKSKCRKTLYLIFFLGTVLLIVWSIHYGSSKYKIASSPFVQEVKEYKQKQLIQISHDTQCYTQGLSFINQTHILQSCGLYQNSYFHILEYKQLDIQTAITIELFRSENFDKKYFLEGSVHFPVNNMIYFLTWQENVVFRYDTDTLKPVDKLAWGSEGWGLTHNNSHLIVSDGSDEIYITNEKMEILEKIKVKDHMGVPKERLNQLEWIKEGDKQFVLANVYTTSEIVKIDLLTGQIVSIFDFKDLTLKEARKKHLEVFNGIAFNQETKTYLLTGKKWGSMYQMIHL